MKSQQDPQWCVILPIKIRTLAKSRLGNSPDVALLAYGFAEKTLRTILACQEVKRILIVTEDDHWQRFESEQISIVADPGGGLNPAICAARDRESDTQPIAVIPSDLALLESTDLADILIQAQGHPLSFVRDKDGTGTTILASTNAVSLNPHYGPNSAAIHLSIGAIELAAPHSVRFDVDTPEDLAQIRMPN